MGTLVTPKRKVGRGARLVGPADVDKMPEFEWPPTAALEARGVHAGAQHGAPTGAHTLPGFLLLLSCLPSRETARSNWVMLSAETPGLQLPSSAACLTACITAANALGLRSAPVCSPLQFLPLPSVAGMPAATRLCVAEEV